VVEALWQFLNCKMPTVLVILFWAIDNIILESVKYDAYDDMYDDVV